MRKRNGIGGRGKTIPVVVHRMDGTEMLMHVRPLTAPTRGEKTIEASLTPGGPVQPVKFERLVFRHRKQASAVGFRFESDGKFDPVVEINAEAVSAAATL